MKKIFALSLTIIVCSLSVVPLGSGPTRGAAAPTRPSPGRQAGVGSGSSGCPSCAQEAEQTIYAPLIRLAESSGTEINLNCRSAHAVDVTPTFYTRAGRAFVGDTFQMQPSEVKTVNLKSLMPPNVRNRQEMGGMALSYTGHPLEMWGQLRLLGVGGGHSVDVLFGNLPDRRSNVRNAVWSMPGHAAAVIAVGNAADAPARAVLRFSDGDTQEVEVPAFGTELIRRRSEQHGRNSGAARADGVAISSADGGRLFFTGAVMSDDRGFTSSIRFYDTEYVAQQNLFATNFRLSHVKPSMALRNTGAESIVATPRFRPVEGGEAAFVDLAAVALAPGESRAVDLGPLTEAARNRPEFAAVSVEVMNTGQKGSLIGVLNGVDERTGLTYDVPLRDIGGLRVSTGAYPWRLDGDFSTVVSITNVATAPSEFVVQINYPGGPYLLNPRKLGGGATATFDLRRIRDEQVPDRNGHTIPRSVEGGQFRWFIHGVASGRLIGRAEMLSVSRGVSSSYSCNMACPPTFARAEIEPEPTSVGVGMTDIQEALEIDADRYGNEYGPYAASVVSWWTWDTGVATTDWGQVTGVAEGTTTATATVEYPLYLWEGPIADCTVGGTRQANANGQVRVDPTVFISGVSASPETLAARINASSTITVQVAASPSVPSGTKVDVQLLLDSRSPTTIQVEPTKNQSGAVGNENVNVAVSPDQPGSCTFTVGTPNTNPSSGNVVYRAFIAAVHDTGSVTVKIANRGGIAEAVTIKVP